MLLIFGAVAFGPAGGEPGTPSGGGGGGVSLADYATVATAAGPVNAATAVRLTESS